MKAGYSKNFLKQYASLNPKFRAKVDQRILLWQTNRLSPQLHDHQLTGKYKAYRSINITGDLRLLYLEQSDSVLFDIIGTHSQLYG